MAAKKVIDMARVRALAKTQNIDQIAAKVGCSRATLVKRCAEEGIPLPRMRGSGRPSETVAGEAEPVTVQAPPAASAEDPLDLVTKAREALPGIRAMRDKAWAEFTNARRKLESYEKFLSAVDEPQPPEDQQQEAAQ